MLSKSQFLALVDTQFRVLHLQDTAVPISVWHERVRVLPHDPLDTCKTLGKTTYLRMSIGHVQGSGARLHIFVCPFLTAHHALLHRGLIYFTALSVMVLFGPTKRQTKEGTNYLIAENNIQTQIFPLLSFPYSPSFFFELLRGRVSRPLYQILLESRLRYCHTLNSLVQYRHRHCSNVWRNGTEPPSETFRQLTTEIDVSTAATENKSIDNSLPPSSVRVKIFATYENPLS